MEGSGEITPAPDAARFAAGGAGDADSLESRIWAHVKHVCSPSHKGRVSTLVKVIMNLDSFGRWQASLCVLSWAYCQNAL